ncbi:hypothetical protein M0802_005856 [Mischocyttarus mexicanus]|nr:hypothetical protein M0802_005856 [Mischocyttarus mexicanus]
MEEVGSAGTSQHDEHNGSTLVKKLKNMEEIRRRRRRRRDDRGRWFRGWGRTRETYSSSNETRNMGKMEEDK